jgi:ATP-dependent protease ClpP protease subunit
MPNWFRFEKSAGSVVDIHIIDFIGDWMDDYWGMGVTARSFLSTLAELPDSVKTIRVHINSPGGDVYSGLTIANALRDQRTVKGRTVETIVDGIAASSASVILMAGNPIRIADNALVMIHNPYSMALGDAKHMREAAAMLDTVRDSIIATYQWHSPMSKSELGQMMDDTSFLDAKAAVKAGLADDIIPGKIEKSATFAPRVIAKLNIPDRFDAVAKALTRPPQTFTIAKSDAMKRQCFGWASVAITADGTQVVDAHEHLIDPDELESAVYTFNLMHREMDANHTEKVEGHLIESMVITPDKLSAMGLAPDALPQGWWVGFQVEDKAVFAKVLSGEYTMFSIAGTAIAVPVE